MTLRSELIALTVTQRMDETIRGPIEVADEYLKVFRDWLVAAEQVEAITETEITKGAKPRYLIGPQIAAVACAALASLTEAKAGTEKGSA